MFVNSSFRRIDSIIGAHFRKSILYIFFSTIILAVFEVLSIGIILPFFDLIMNFGEGEKGMVFFNLLSDYGLSQKEVIIAVGAAIILIFIAKNILHFLVNKFQSRVIHSLRVSISKRLFEKYIKMNYSQFIERKLASMVRNTNGQVNNFVLIFLRSILQFASELIVIIAILSLLLLVNPKLMLAVLVFGILIVGTMFKRFKSIFVQIGEKQNEATVSMYKVVFEGIGALKEIRVLRVEPYFIETFDRSSKAYKEMAVYNDSIKVIPKLLLELIFMFSLVGVVTVSIILNYELTNLIPTLVLFTLAFFKIFPSINRLISNYNLVATSKISFDVLYNELVEEKAWSRSSDSKGNKELSFDKSVSFQNVTFAYENSPKILQNFSMEILKNKTTAIVGKSGSGKTTVMDLMLGLIQPQEGSVKLDDEKINRNLDSWYTKLSYIPQSISFIDDSIKNNIALGVEDIDQVQLNRSIKEAQLQEFVKNLKDGLETNIGDKGIKLSGGQRQRIGIARALYKNPEVLLFDEATSALDVETERALTDSIFRLGKTKTIIIVAHRISTIKNSDVIYILDAGKIKDYGTYEELIERDEWFKEINK